jgi:hypothetical protein
MSRASDYPADRKGIRVRHRVRDGENKCGTFVEYAGTWQAITAVRAVRTLIWSLDENTQATERGGVTSEVLSASWATSLIWSYACVAIVVLVYCGRRLFYLVQPKSTDTVGPSIPKWRRKWVRLRTPTFSRLRRWRKRWSLIYLTD